MLTRSKHTRLYKDKGLRRNFRQLTHKRTPWEEVYHIRHTSTPTLGFPGIVCNTTYYQTYGGGPEGGYIVYDTNGEVHTIEQVHRTGAFDALSVVRIYSPDCGDFAVFEFKPADEAKGRPARCRLYTRTENI